MSDTSHQSTTAVSQRLQALQEWESCRKPDVSTAKLSAEDQMGHLAIDPVFSAAISIHSLLGLGGLTSEGLGAALYDAVDDVTLRQNMSAPEAMLLTQAHCLDALWHKMMRVALGHQKNIRYFEQILKLALRAQNQSRMTLETLAALKAPPTVFARQMNVAQGHQQINNASPPHAHAREVAISPNELLERLDGTSVDTRAPGKASRSHTKMGSVGKEYRSKKSGR